MKPLKDILKNPLLKLSSLNTLSVFTRIVGGLISSKVTAVFIGPSGLALTGSFRNFLSSLDAFSTLGLQNGIIKFTAQHEKDRQKQYDSLCTAFVLIGIAVVVMGLALAVPATFWSQRIFNGRERYAWIFRLTGLLLPLYSASIVFMSVLNGFSRFKAVIWTTIAANAVGVTVSGFMIWQMGVTGAFMGLLFTACVTCLFCAMPLYKITNGFAFLKAQYFKPSLFKPLLSYSLMAVVSAVLAPLIYIALRNMIINGSGTSAAGYWEGISRISSFYMMFLTTLLGVYFLPRLSRAEDNAGYKAVFREYYRIVMPLFATGLLLVYVLKGVVITLLLSEYFMPMKALFIWQLLGDFFKGCSLILGHMFFARKMTRAFILSELVSFAILYVSGYVLIDLFSATGAVMAHAFTYFVYFVTLSVYFRKQLF